MTSGAQRTVLVTGATSGIGRAVAARLLEEGHRVVGVGRDFSKVSFAGSFAPVVLDLADLDALPARLRDLADEHPAVDALVLAAGRGLVGGLEQCSYRRLRELIDLNVTSQAFLVRAFVPALKRRRQGDVVFIGSEAALRGARQGAVYCASKFALRGFAQALRDECAKSGVKVSIVHPGMVRTPFFDDLAIAPGDGEENALLPEEVAAAVALVLAQRGGAVVDEIVLSPLKNVVRRRAH